MLGALVHYAPGILGVLTWRREEQPGAGRLQEVEVEVEVEEGCLVPLHMTPPGI